MFNIYTQIIQVIFALLLGIECNTGISQDAKNENHEWNMLKLKIHCSPIGLESSFQVARYGSVAWVFITFFKFLWCCSNGRFFMSNLMLRFIIQGVQVFIWLCQIVGTICVLLIPKNQKWLSFFFAPVLDTEGMDMNVRKFEIVWICIFRIWLWMWYLFNQHMP